MYTADKQHGVSMPGAQLSLWLEGQRGIHAMDTLQTWQHASAHLRLLFQLQQLGLAG
jgi:hypothetical protein